MSATYGEGSQQVRRQQEDEARRKWEGEAKRRTEEQKRQQPEGTQEAARKVDETKRRAQEEAKQKSQRVNLLSREEVGRIASLQNVASTEKGEISGEVVNHSKQTLREVRLQTLYSWRWKNENRPGKDDPEGPLIIF
jgi:membrane protein involved in colicin uptake